MSFKKYYLRKNNFFTDNKNSTCNGALNILLGNYRFETIGLKVKMLLATCENALRFHVGMLLLSNRYSVSMHIRKTHSKN